MLQLIPNGPEIPLEVLNAIEEDRLVFFCGAGVSVYSGLPLFRELVNRIYQETKEKPTGPEIRAIKMAQYDKALGFLEERLLEGLVRKSVKRVLDQKSSIPLTLHKALLDLSRVVDGFRIVTTNFDRRFLEAGSLSEAQVWRAPALAMPKNYFWKSLVHLHGLIADEDPTGANLVLTAADFGRAYLAEGWAARFVVELFRQFTVLFIGYGVNDPILSYLVDALASESTRGQFFRRAFAFAPHSHGKKNPRGIIVEEWRAKGVVPIPYWERHHHRLLHQTLVEWAKLRRGGITSRKHFALREARSKQPPKPGSQDAKRLVWALLEESGAVANVFAESRPQLPFEWLETIEGTSFIDPLSQQEGSTLLNLPSQVPIGGKRQHNQPIVALAGSDTSSFSPLRPPTQKLALWLARHCDKPDFLRWVLCRGPLLHPTLANFVANEIEEDQNRIPSALSQVWKVLLGMPHKRWATQPQQWFEMIQISDTPDILDPIVRQKIVEALRLLPVIRARVWFPDETIPQDGSKLQPSDLVDINMRFNQEGAAFSVLKELRENPLYSEFLSLTCDNFTTILKEGLEWFEVLGRASSTYDRSYSDQPSIAIHEQNHYLNEWAHLIDILRDAIEFASKHDLESALIIAQRWASIRFPLFERLLIHAGTESMALAPLSVNVMLRDGGQALWSFCCEREVLRFLRLGTASLSMGNRVSLERTFILGPPRSQYREDLSDDDAEKVMARATWIRLAKLNEGCGFSIPEVGEQFQSYARKYGWEIERDERDEFPVWIGPASWQAKEDNWIANISSSSRQDAHQQILEETESDNIDSWKIRWLARNKTSLALSCIRSLRNSGSLSKTVTDEFFLGLRDIESPRRLRRTLLVVAPLLRDMLSARPPEATWGIAHLFKYTGKILDKRVRDDCGITVLWSDVWSAAEQDPAGKDQDALTAAINHPSGFLTQMLLQDISTESLRDAITLSQDLVDQLEVILNGDSVAHRLGRTVLASQLLFVFEFAKEKIVTKLIPRFNWSSSNEAGFLWEGYLYNPRLTADLFVLLKKSFLDSFDHLEAISPQLHRGIGELLGVLAIEFPSMLSWEENSASLRMGNEEIALGVLGAFIQFMKADEGHAPVLWREIIGTWFEQCWPRGRDLFSREPKIASFMFELAFVGSDAYPDIVEAIQPYLANADRHELLYKLSHQNIFVISRFPQATLALLDSIFPKSGPVNPVSSLGPVLQSICNAWPEANNDKRFIRLMDTAVSCL